MSTKAVKHRAGRHRAVKRSAAKHSANGEEVVRQMVQQLGPNTRLAKLTVANWKAEKAARLLKPSAAGDMGIVKIPLEQLDDSPYQLRHDMDQDQLAELARSIRDRGLLNPILVRPAEKGWEVISGHRRLGAYRRLQFAAKTDAEKQKYDAIPARELDVTDDQVLLFGIAENMFRADISPLDAGLGLATLQKLKPALSSAAKIADTTDLPLRKVERLMHLAASPEVVQKGVSDGIKVPVDPDQKKDGGDDDESAEETRTLDLMSALQFTRLHEALSKKGGKTKDGKSTADAQTGTAIAHALKENWGLRDVTLYVNKAIAKLNAPAPKKGRGRPVVGFRKTTRQLVVYYAQVNALTDTQRQTLRKALQELLQKLDERPHAPALAHRTHVRKSA